MTDCPHGKLTYLSVLEYLIARVVITRLGGSSVFTSRTPECTEVDGR